MYTSQQNRCQFKILQDLLSSLILNESHQNEWWPFIHKNEQLCSSFLQLALGCFIYFVFIFTTQTSQQLLHFYKSVNYLKCCCLVTKLCPTLLRPHCLQPTKLLCPWGFRGKNTEVGCHFFLPGTFTMQGSDFCLLRWQIASLLLSHQGSPLFYIFFSKFVFPYSPLIGI